MGYIGTMISSPIHSINLSLRRCGLELLGWEFLGLVFLIQGQLWFWGTVGPVASCVGVGLGAAVFYGRLALKGHCMLPRPFLWRLAWFTGLGAWLLGTLIYRWMMMQFGETFMETGHPWFVSCSLGLLLGMVTTPSIPPGDPMTVF